MNPVPVLDIEESDGDGEPGERAISYLGRSRVSSTSEWLAEWEIEEEAGEQLHYRVRRLAELLQASATRFEAVIRERLAEVELSRAVLVRLEESPPHGRTQELFEQLAHEWRRDTLGESSFMRIVVHRSYQRIIGLGPEVVPLILLELEREPRLWFWALTAITGENPAEGEDTVRGAADRWLEWGRQHKYLS
jgi:hypothetical protein